MSVCTIVNVDNPRVKKDFFHWNQPYFRFISTRIPRMDIPVEFWRTAGKALRQLLHPGNVERQECPDGFRVMMMRNQTSREQIALLSIKDTYVAAKMTLPPGSVRKLTSFPYSPLQITDAGVLALKDHQQPLHLPPQGIVLVEIFRPMDSGK